MGAIEVLLNYWRIAPHNASSPFKHIGTGCPFKPTAPEYRNKLRSTTTLISPAIQGARDCPNTEPGVMFPQAQERVGLLWRGKVCPAHRLVLGLIVVEGVALLLLSFHFLHPGLHPLHSSLPKEKVPQSHSQRDVQNTGLAYRRLYQSILGAATDKQTMRQSDRRFLSKDQRGRWRVVWFRFWEDIPSGIHCFDHEESMCHSSGWSLEPWPGRAPVRSVKCACSRPATAAVQLPAVLLYWGDIHLMYVWKD